MTVLKTDIEILITDRQVNISQDIAPDLLAFSYSDKETDEADEISLTLKDPDGKWAGSWKPDGGERIEAAIITSSTDDIENLIGLVTGREQAAPSRLPCGKFHIDSQRTSGSPRVMEIKGISIPLNTPIRKKLKTKAWEKTTLKAIATAIAKANSVGLIWDSQENPAYDRQDQKRETDLKFLSRLCKDNGLSIKASSDRIVIFDQASYEKKTSVKTYILGQSAIISWDFETQQSETYKSVTVSYRDPRKKKRGSAGSHKTSRTTTATAGKNPAVHEYTYTDPEADANGQEYSLKKRATSIDEARRLARAKLRELNQRKITGTLTVVGDVETVAGVVITCIGFGSFDGNFIVEEAHHTVGASGYTTQLRLRRVNMNY